MNERKICFSLSFLFFCQKSTEAHWNRNNWRILLVRIFCSLVTLTPFFKKTLSFFVNKSPKHECWRLAASEHFIIIICFIIIIIIIIIPELILMWRSELRVEHQPENLTMLNLFLNSSSTDGTAQWSSLDQLVPGEPVECFCDWCENKTRLEIKLFPFKHVKVQTGWIVPPELCWVINQSINQ